MAGVAMVRGLEVVIVEMPSVEARAEETAEGTARRASQVQRQAPRPSQQSHQGRPTLR